MWRIRSAIQLQEMMEERGVEVDHAILNRWALTYVPLLYQAFRVRRRRVGGSWRMDETSGRSSTSTMLNRTIERS
jgi:transposase-like protein